MSTVCAVLGFVPCRLCNMWRRRQRSWMIVQSTRRPCSSDACYGTKPRCSRSTEHFVDVIRRLPCYIILENFGARACRFRRGIRVLPFPQTRQALQHWPSRTSIMSTHNVLKQLHGLDRTSSQFHKRLSGLLRSEAYRSAVPNLQGEDLAWLVDYLENVSIQSISPKSAPDTFLGSDVYFKSCEPRVPRIFTRTQEHLRHQGGPTKIPYASKFSPSHCTLASFRTRP